MADDDEHVKQSWIIENTWSCRSCKAENQGRDMVCRQCGASRDKHRQDVAADAESAVAISDERLVAQAEAGANWVCTYCNTQQRGLQAWCENCGGERERGTTLPPEEPAQSLGENAS